MSAPDLSRMVVSVVDVVVPEDRADELTAGFREMLASSPQPDGMFSTELLRGQDGRWRVQTNWRDREALLAVRANGETPAVLALLDRLGLAHEHAIFTVAAYHQAR
jgi:quinol monooxygenase YgiN